MITPLDVLRVKTDSAQPRTDLSLSSLRRFPNLLPPDNLIGQVNNIIPDDPIMRLVPDLIRQNSSSIVSILGYFKSGSCLEHGPGPLLLKIGGIITLF